MNRFTILLIFCLGISGSSLLHAAETAYITDEFEVTLRSGTSTTNSIVRMLPSGAAVTVLEKDLASQYSLVETVDGKQGYVLSRFLMDSPAARQSIETLRNRFNTQRENLNAQTLEIASLKQALEQANNDNNALKSTLRSLENELTDIRSAAADTLNTMEQNRRLESVLAQLREEQTQLSETNAELSDSRELDWFVRGAAVSLLAFIIGIVVTRIRWKKQDSWGSY